MRSKHTFGSCFTLSLTCSRHMSSLWFKRVTEKAAEFPKRPSQKHKTLKHTVRSTMTLCDRSMFTCSTFGASNSMSRRTKQCGLAASDKAALHAVSIPPASKTSPPAQLRDEIRQPSRQRADVSLSRHALWLLPGRRNPTPKEIPEKDTYMRGKSGNITVSSCTSAKIDTPNR